MKLVLTHYLSAEEPAASEEVLDVFTHSLMKLRSHKYIYTGTFQMHK